MGIATVNNNRQDNKINIKTAVIVDKDVSINKMIQYIDGDNWSVNYYNNIKRVDDLNENIDVNQPNLENQFTLIEKLTLKVTSPLETDNLDNITGEAIIPVNIVAQVGDMFTARIISGEIGIFIITNVTEKSYKLDRIFNIEYKLYTTNTINPSLIDDLNSRVVKKFIYDDDVALDNKNPLLLDTDHATYRRLHIEWKHLTDLYYKEFIKENNYLLYTEDNMNIFDPYITYLYSIVKYEDNKHFNIKDMSNDMNSFVYNILNKDSDIIYSNCHIKNNGIGVPLDVYRLRDNLPFDIQKVITMDNRFPIYKITCENDFLPTRDDNKYLLGGNSIVEIMCEDLIKDKDIDYKKLIEVLDSVKSWNNKEKYWYLPIMLFIIREGIFKMKSII